jgi:hypothetical protein
MSLKVVKMCGWFVQTCFWIADVLLGLSWLESVYFDMLLGECRNVQAIVPDRCSAFQIAVERHDIGLDFCSRRLSTYDFLSIAVLLLICATPLDVKIFLCMRPETGLTSLSLL